MNPGRQESILRNNPDLVVERWSATQTGEIGHPTQNSSIPIEQNQPDNDEGKNWYTLCSRERGAAGWSPLMLNRSTSYCLAAAASKARPENLGKEEEDMAFSKYLIISLIVLCLAGLVVGCGSDTVAPPPSNQQAPLLPPLNLTASRTGAGDIMLVWDPNTQSNLLGYNVYRSISGTGDFHKLNPAIVVGNSYVDDGVSPNTRYDYRVTSVGSNGLESDYAAISIYNGPNPRTGGNEKLHD